MTPCRSGNNEYVRVAEDKKYQQIQDVPIRESIVVMHQAKNADGQSLATEK